MTELAANVLAHTAVRSGCELVRRERNEIHIAVSDTSPDLPRRLRNVPVGGRGIRIVNAIARTWVTRPNPVARPFGPTSRSGDDAAEKGHWAFAVTVPRAPAMGGRHEWRRRNLVLTERVDAFQRRHPVAGFLIGVLYKFGEDQGPYLAALITYYGFLSLFPLMLLLASVLGFVLEGHPEWQQRVLDSTLSQFPVIGDQLADPQGLQGSIGAIVVGGLVALYGALGVAQAIQHAMNVTWSVPRNRRPNPVRARLRSLRLIALVGLAAVITTIVSSAGSNPRAFGAHIGRWSTVGALVLSIVVNGTVFVVTFRIFRPDHVRSRDVMTGALVAAVIWQLLQFFGAVFVTHVVKDSGTTYGVFAVVLGLLAWIFLAAIGVVIGSEVNVVRTKRLYPRALLTPFTDNVELTDADRRAYLDAVNAQRFKGFQSVTVRYDSVERSSSQRSRPPEPPGHDEPN